MKEFVTERLRLRGWRRGDAPALAAMNADPEVMRYIGSGAKPYAEALERAESLLRERPVLWSENESPRVSVLTLGYLQNAGYPSCPLSPRLSARRAALVREV